MNVFRYVLFIKFISIIGLVNFTFADTEDCITCSCVEHVLKAVAGSTPSLPTLSIEEQYCTWAKPDMTLADANVVHLKLQPAINFFTKQESRLDEKHLDQYLKTLSENIAEKNLQQYVKARKMVRTMKSS